MNYIYNSSWGYMIPFYFWEGVCRGYTRLQNLNGRQLVGVMLVTEQENHQVIYRLLLVYSNFFKLTYCLFLCYY